MLRQFHHIGCVVQRTGIGLTFSKSNATGSGSCTSLRRQLCTVDKNDESCSPVENFSRQFHSEWALRFTDMKKINMLTRGKAVYEGELQDRKKHGFGKIVHPGAVYVGDWVNDEMEGNGSIHFMKSGTKYVGNFVMGKMEGSGVMTNADGTVYTGEFFADKQHGQGKLHLANGSKYIGTFVNGFREGYGESTSYMGDVYKGHWSGNKMNGEGMLALANGKKIKGIFTNGRCEITMPESKPFFQRSKNEHGVKSVIQVNANFKKKKDKPKPGSVVQMDTKLKKKKEKKDKPVTKDASA